jgi:hypothetical protein
MSRSIELPLTVRKEDPDVSVFVLIDPEANREWCLGLCLLKEGLIESLTILGERGEYGLKISLDSSLTSRRGKVRFRRDEVDVSISTTELDYWVRFFLKYYRDGVGDVNHIDVEIPSRDPDSTRRLGLVLQIPDAVAPISEEEARGRLGLS